MLRVPYYTCAYSSIVFSPFCRVYYREDPIMHASTAHIFHLTWSRTNFICIPSCDTLRYTFRVSRVYSSSQLCRGLSFHGSSMRAMLWGLRVRNIARRAPSPHFRRTAYCRMSGFSRVQTLTGGSCCFVCEGVEGIWMCYQSCFFRESPLFCGQSSVTDL